MCIRDRPDAPVKFFITASSRERALRRQKELAEKGVQTELDALEQEIIARDRQDAGREFAPLRQAEDAIVLDTTHMTIPQVLDLSLIHI